MLAGNEILGLVVWAIVIGWIQGRVWNRLDGPRGDR